MNAQANSPVFQTVYVSSASALIDEASLQRLLVDWRPKNASLGITGMMLYSEGNIIQVLEGEKSKVEELMFTIASDPRHRGVIVLIQETVEERHFADWSMGFKGVSGEEAEGLSDFFKSTHSEDEAKLRAGRAKTLLLRFKSSMV
jgi:hypothetical protein